MHRLTAWTLDHPRLSAVLLLLVTLAAALAAPRVESVFGYRVLLGPEHPVVRDLDSLIEEFGGGQPQAGPADRRSHCTIRGGR